MTLVNMKQFLFWPGYTTAAETNYGSSSATTLDAAGEYYAVVIQAAEDMSIRTVDLFFHAATSCDVDIRIETLDSGGLPSGTLWATSTNKIQTVNGANTFYSVTLDATATVTRSQKFALVIKYSSGTTASPAHLISGRAAAAMWRGSTFPYIVNNTGTPAKAAFPAGSLPFALGDATPTFYQVSGLVPFGALAAQYTMSNTAAIRAVALRFQVPFACRVIGMRFDDSSAAATDDVSCVIYDSSGTELSSTLTAINRDETFIGGGIVSCFFDNPVTLAANTTYRAAVVPDTANNTLVSYLTLNSTARAGALVGGSQCYSSTRDSGGTWTDTTTTVTRIDLIIDQIDDGAGSGGAVGGGIAGLHGITNGVVA